MKEIFSHVGTFYFAKITKQKRVTKKKKGLNNFRNSFSFLMSI